MGQSTKSWRAYTKRLPTISERYCSVLDTVLSRDTNLDLWKEVVRASTRNRDSEVYHKVQGKYEKTVIKGILQDFVSVENP